MAEEATSPPTLAIVNDQSETLYLSFPGGCNSTAALSCWIHRGGCCWSCPCWWSRFSAFIIRAYYTSHIQSSLFQFSLCVINYKCNMLDGILFGFGGDKYPSKSETERESELFSPSSELDSESSEHSASSIMKGLRLRFWSLFIQLIFILLEEKWQMTKDIWFTFGDVSWSWSWSWGWSWGCRWLSGQ